MAAIELQQRCWNHEAREAACRCPGCGRSYCRECVSEHEGRLLCAACLIAITAGRAPSRGRGWNLAPAAMIAAAILLAWLTYWVAGASVISVLRRIQQEPKSGAGASACQPHTTLAAVGQAVGFRRVLFRAVGPRNSMKTRWWGMLQLANRPEGRVFSPLSSAVAIASHRPPPTAPPCPTSVLHA